MPQVGHAGHRRGVRNRQALLRRFEIAACRNRGAVASGGHDVVERHVVGAQPIGIDQHLELPIALTPDGDVGDAGNRHQARPDRPLRERGQLDL